MSTFTEKDLNWHFLFKSIKLFWASKGMEFSKGIIKQLNAPSAGHTRNLYSYKQELQEKVSHTIITQSAIVHRNGVYFIQGDVKGYLRSCRATDSVTPDPLILQRMACEIASGLLYLHKHNYIHRWGSLSCWPFPCIIILWVIFLSRHFPDVRLWCLLATISWCCLSTSHRLQHQWFCCWGKTPHSTNAINYL